MPGFFDSMFGPRLSQEQRDEKTRLNREAKEKESANLLANTQRILREHNRNVYSSTRLPSKYKSWTEFEQNTLSNPEVAKEYNDARKQEIADLVAEAGKNAKWILIKKNGEDFYTDKKSGITIARENLPEIVVEDFELEPHNSRKAANNILASMGYGKDLFAAQQAEKNKQAAAMKRLTEAMNSSAAEEERRQLARTEQLRRNLEEGGYALRPGMIGPVMTFTERARRNRVAYEEASRLQKERHRMEREARLRNSLQKTRNNRVPVKVNINRIPGQNNYGFIGPRMTFTERTRRNRVAYEEASRLQTERHRMEREARLRNSMNRNMTMAQLEHHKKLARARLGPQATKVQILDEVRRAINSGNVPNRNTTIKNVPKNVPKNNTTQKTSTAHWHQPVKAKTVKKPWYKFF